MDAHFEYMLQPTLPKQEEKRKREDEEFERPQKKALTREDIEQIVNEGAEVEIEAINELSTRKIVLSLEKKINKNQEMRTKYYDSPEKFMESEIDLDEELKKMQTLAAYPEYYSELVKLNAVRSLVQLLNHENTIISASVVELLQEFLEPNTAAEAPESTLMLIESFIENNGLEFTINNLNRMDDTNEDESQAIHHTFSLIENLCELKPETASIICQRTGVLLNLLQRLKKKRSFDQNKLYAAEILSILLQQSEENKRKIGELEEVDGVDTLLQIVSYYRKRDPATQEEAEMVDNLFDCVCSVLMIPNNQDRFRRSEGLELMLRTVKEGKYARRNAWKVIDYCTTDNAANCNRFVEIGGLKALFPTFSGKIRRKHELKFLCEQSSDIQTVEEHTISIVSSLALLLSHGSVSQARFVAKFIEEDFEKVDLLMEKHEKYVIQVRESEKRLEGDDLDEEEAFLERLDAGLYTLFRIDTTLGILICLRSEIRDRVNLLLTQKGSTMDEIRNYIIEHLENIGDVATRTDQDTNALRSRIAGICEAI